MSQQGRYQKKKKKTSAWKVALIVFLCFALFIGAGVVCGYMYLDSKLNMITQAQIEEKDTSGQDLSALIGVFESSEPTVAEESEPTVVETVPETEAATEAPTEPDYGKSGKIVNILVVGQDSREGEASKLADSIMLFTLNKETKQLTVTSFLRDSYVNLPDYYRGHTCGWNRINTSYALGYAWFGDGGAMEMLNLTIQDNYGVEIDGNVEISLSAFETIIDSIGGIDIDLYDDELDYMNNVAVNRGTRALESGTNHLTGLETLDYARMRHANAGDSDMNRTARQRHVVEEILKKFKSMSILELNALLDEVLPMVITNISPDDMKVYIAELLPYIFDIEMVSNQCPADGTYHGEIKELPDGAGGVLIIDFTKNKKLMMEICEEQS